MLQGVRGVKLGTPRVRGAHWLSLCHVTILITWVAIGHLSVLLCVDVLVIAVTLHANLLQPIFCYAAARRFTRLIYHVKINLLLNQVIVFVVTKP